MNRFKLSLDTVAKSVGADKYTGFYANTNIYIPQSISRVCNVVQKELYMSIFKTEQPGSLQFTLINLAAKAGGDKYVCDTDKKFVIYFPQAISRSNKTPFAKLYVTLDNYDIIDEL